MYIYIYIIDTCAMVKSWIAPGLKPSRGGAVVGVGGALPREPWAMSYSKEHDALRKCGVPSSCKAPSTPSPAAPAAPAAPQVGGLHHGWDLRASASLRA